MVDQMRESPRGRSMLALYQDCPRKWAWKYLKGYKLLDEKDHFTFGSAVHESQAEYYLNDFDYYIMLKKAEAFLLEKERIDMLPKVRASLMLWYDLIGEADEKLVTVLECEAEDNLILQNGFDMTMRRDRVLQYTATEEIFINDTKTTQWSLAGTLKNYMYSDQPQLYIASALQNKPEWTPKLSGWRTDCIYLPKGACPKNDWGATKNAVRSDISTFTQSRIEGTMKSYAVQTSDMGYKVQCVLEDDDPISSHFPMCNGNCLAYHSVCEYYNFCHEIDTIAMPPAQFGIDDWLESGAVLDGFKGLKE